VNRRAEKKSLLSLIELFVAAFFIFFMVFVIVWLYLRITAPDSASLQAYGLMTRQIQTLLDDKRSDGSFASTLNFNYIGPFKGAIFGIDSDKKVSDPFFFVLVKPGESEVPTTTAQHTLSNRLDSLRQIKSDIEKEADRICQAPCLCYMTSDLQEPQDDAHKRLEFFLKPNTCHTFASKKKVTFALSPSYFTNEQKKYPELSIVKSTAGETVTIAIKPEYK
jgi:hypothetical protein